MQASTPAYFKQIKLFFALPPIKHRTVRNKHKTYHDIIYPGFLSTNSNSYYAKMHVGLPKARVDYVLHGRGIHNL